MQTKDFAAKVKAAGPDDGLEEGQFKAIVSVFGNTDSVGDVVMPGAFEKDLERWTSSGDAMPVIWSHDWADPFSHIGQVVKADEVEAGLQVIAELDLDNPKAQQVYRLLKGRRVTQFSFAYDVLDAGWGEKDGQEVYELRELKVHEVGPCLVGANQDTELLAVKAARLASGAKAGQVLSKTNYDRLVEARDAISVVIDAATEETSEATAPEKTDEPSQTDKAADEDEEPTHDGAPAKSSDAAKSVARRALAVARITNLS